MANSRITVTVIPSEDGSPDAIELYLNEEGRRILMEELTALDMRNDHFHFFTPDWGGEELRAVPYRPEQKIAHHLKVLFRPDEWDQQYYPHVMGEQE